MKKITIPQLVTFLASLNLESLPLVIHVSTTIKAKLFELKQWTDETMPKNLCFTTDGMDELLESENYLGELAYIFVMTLDPGQNDYFWMKYEIFESGNVVVTSESASGEHKDLFERFTGKRDAFNVELEKVPTMIASDLEMAKSINERVSKTVEEAGEVETVEDIESRLG